MYNIVIGGNYRQGILNSKIQPIMELQKLLSVNCKIESVYPTVLVSDAEVNIVTVTVICPQGQQ
jgi:hypothetical protein